MKMLSSTYNTRAILKNSLRYIRSDVPTTINKEDKLWLMENNIKTIIDLRTDHEQQAKRCPLKMQKEFNYYSIPLTGADNIPLKPELVPVSYINMVDDKLRQVLDIAMNAKTNVLYFCNMGKDRTGVVSAVILKKLGINEDEIVADYVASFDNVKEILERFVKDNPQIDINVITPKEQYIKKFLEMLDLKNI